MLLIQVQGCQQLRLIGKVGAEYPFLLNFNYYEQPFNFMSMPKSHFTVHLQCKISSPGRIHHRSQAGMRNPRTCEVVAIRRYLKLRCLEEDNSTYFICTNGNGTYRVSYDDSTDFGMSMPNFNISCGKGRHYGPYQFCGHLKRGHDEYNFDEPGVLCENPYKHWYEQSILPEPDVDNRKDVVNTGEYTESYQSSCPFDCKMFKGNRRRMKSVSCKKLCDNRCDCPNCADESNIREITGKECPGYPNGMICNKTFTYRDRSNATDLVYIEPYMICDGESECDGNEDEEACPSIDDNGKESLSPFWNSSGTENGDSYENESHIPDTGNKDVPYDKNKTNLEYCSYSLTFHKDDPTIHRNRSLHPNQKCAKPNFWKSRFVPICDDFSDQFNCPDESMNAVECHVNIIGQRHKLTNLSKYLTTDCKIRDKIIDHILINDVESGYLPYDWNIDGIPYSFCNDSIDDQCINLDDGCYVHKHKMCDNHTDCVLTERDEKNDNCKDMEDVMCVRRVGGLNRTIPSNWVEDGIKDCQDGLDEDQEFWKEHRKNYTICGDPTDWSSIGSKNCSNEKYYFCSNNTKEMISFDKLCDRIPSCGNEERVCRVARNQDIFWVSFSNSRKIQKELSYCLPGLEDLETLINPCMETGIETFSESDQIFGVEDQNSLFVLPNRTVNCRVLYGMPYILATCNNMCIDKETTCKFTNLRRDSCENVPEKDKIYTVATPKNEDPYLTLVKKVGASFIPKQLFTCANGRACVTYDKVCNLANDCWDWSDERNCTNQFICTSNRTEGQDRIPWSRYCDAVFDCPDHSDECGEGCHHFQGVIENTPLTVLCWTFGLLATLFNMITLITTSFQVISESSFIKIVNLIMILFIGLGDLCLGLYLIAISVVNYRYQKGYPTFCQDYYRWLTSDTCSALGVLNTFGSQLSLYSMTVLSVFRVFCVKKVNIRGIITWKGILMVTLLGSIMVLLSATISVIPLFPQLEDYYVNGMAYFNNPLLIRSYNKGEHSAILKEHYGKFHDQALTWKQIMKMVSDMFSQFNHEPVVRRKVNFYGNSGVCLFKFFVRDDDPQKGFAWIVIFQNAFCFLVISFSYMIVYLTVSDSTKAVISNSRKKISQNLATASRKNRSGKNRVLNRKITMVILTDFLCWIPFIAVCGLHYFEVFDATRWYSLFSIVILPLNSVINPLLYDNSGILDATKEKLLKFYNKVGNSEGQENKRTISESELSKIKSDPNVQMSEVKDRTVELKDTAIYEEAQEEITIHPVSAL